MADTGVDSPEGERPPGLYHKLVLLTGIRLAVGTALLVATAWLTVGHEPFPRAIEVWLYAIVGSMYVASLIEPVMMVVLGGVVGGFLVAMYLPIFSIAGAVK